MVLIYKAMFSLLRWQWQELAAVILSEDIKPPQIYTVTFRHGIIFYDTKSFIDLSAFTQEIFIKKINKK